MQLRVYLNVVFIIELVLVYGESEEVKWRIKKQVLLKRQNRLELQI